MILDQEKTGKEGMAAETHTPDSRELEALRGEMFGAEVDVVALRLPEPFSSGTFAPSIDNPCGTTRVSLFR